MDCSVAPPMMNISPGHGKPISEGLIVIGFPASKRRQFSPDSPNPRTGSLFSFSPVNLIIPVIAPWLQWLRTADRLCLRSPDQRRNKWRPRNDLLANPAELVLKS